MRVTTFTRVMCWLAVSVSGPALAQTPIWGPEEFSRGTGEPLSEIRGIAAPDASWAYRLVIENAGSKRVSSGSVSVNGLVVVGPEDFSQNVERIERPVTLALMNVLEVQIRSAPESALKISVLGPSSATLVEPSGGIATLDGFATVRFPAGAFSEPASVIIFPSASAETQEEFRYSTEIFDAGESPGYEIRIVTGKTAPTLPLEVDIEIPKSFLDGVPTTSDLQAFVQYLESGGMEVVDIFEILPSSFDPAARTLSVSLPPVAFTSRRNPRDDNEAILVFGTTPKVSGTPAPGTSTLGLASGTARPAKCGDLHLSFPLDEDVPPNPARPFEKGVHDGRDYPVDAGLPVHPAARGKIVGIRIPPEERPVDDEPGELCAKPFVDSQGNRRCIKGYGYYVLIEHEGGARTLYAHLQEGSIQNLKLYQTVETSDTIGLTNNTGGSTGDHLHFEFAPNGAGYFTENSGRIDPDPCIDRAALKVDSVSPADGARISGDQSFTVTLVISPASAAVPPGTSVQVFVLGDKVQEKALKAAGPSKYSMRIPNMWGEPSVDVSFKIVRDGKVLDEKELSYISLYNWSAIGRGKWDVTYSWTFDWKSKSVPGRTALEKSSGHGFMGNYGYRAAPFVEDYSRVAWVNSYQFTYDDQKGCSYLVLGTGSHGLLYYEIEHDSCFQPPTGYLDLHNWMKYGYAKLEAGAFSFQGPEGVDDRYTSELGFVRKGNTDYPSITGSRTYKTESKESMYTIELNVSFRRVPPGE